MKEIKTNNAEIQLWLSISTSIWNQDNVFPSGQQSTLIWLHASSEEDTP